MPWRIRQWEENYVQEETQVSQEEAQDYVRDRKRMFDDRVIVHIAPQKGGKGKPYGNAVDVKKAYDEVNR